MRDALAIAFQSITKSYGATLALDDVDLAVGSGEVVALMGANGAGKSTLAKIASGVVQPDRGSIAVAGRVVRPMSPRAAREAGIVIVHQSTDQLGVPGLSIAENLVLDGLCDGSAGWLTTPGRLRQRAKAIADAIGLDLPLDRDFGELGPAHRQLVAIARAVASKATVLILDEPTASLAAEEAKHLFEVIEGLRSRGVGILYISHRLADIRRIADRIVVLRNGRRVAEHVHRSDRPLDLAAAIQAMVGRDVVAHARGAIGAPTTTAVLRLDQIRLTATSAPFDLAIRAGEIVAVTGALGSGKSRLLQALFGLKPLFGGRVELDGKPWQPRSPMQAIAGGVFFAGEDRWRSTLLPPETPGSDIAGTIALPHRPRWFPAGLVRRDVERAAAGRAIQSLGIRCRDSDDTLDVLSGGNQQKVVIGRWQAAPYRLLLLDEPFQGVDVGARNDLIAAIHGSRRDSATLIATSDVEEACEVADVVVVMRGQSIVVRHDLRIDSAISLIATIGAVEAAEAVTPEGTAS